MRFLPVEVEDTHLLELFVQRAGNSLESFRYFSKRPFSVVRNHICTWVIEDRGQIEAYGHLDREGDTVWLGIAVTYSARGRGLGRRMMQRLMQSGKEHSVRTITLAVDNGNEVAIKLYEQFEFRLLRRETKISYYEWRARQSTPREPQQGGHI